MYIVRRTVKHKLYKEFEELNIKVEKSNLLFFDLINENETPVMP